MDLSPHIDIITRASMMFLAIVLEVVGSIKMVLPKDNGVLLGSLPHTKCSCLAARVTAFWSFTVPIWQGISSCRQCVIFDIRSKKCSLSGDNCVAICDMKSQYSSMLMSMSILFI